VAETNTENDGEAEPALTNQQWGNRAKKTGTMAHLEEPASKVRLVLRANTRYGQECPDVVTVKAAASRRTP
jgi:hypothetical protein